MTAVERPQHLPKGANACRNHGLGLARGKYVLFLDSDDALLPKALAVHQRNFSSPSILGSFTKYGTTTAASWSDGDIPWPIYATKIDLLTAYLSKQILIPINCVAWAKQSLPAQPFNVTLQSGQDFAYIGSRLAQTVLEDVAFSDKSTTLITIDPTSITRSPSAVRVAHYLRARLLLLEGGNLPTKAVRAMLKYARRFYYELITDFPGQERAIAEQFKVAAERADVHLMSPYWAKLERRARAKFRRIGRRLKH